jgi:hypothetical protein
MNRVKLLNFGCATGLIALLGVASGCSEPATQWSRPGTGDAIRNADYQECRSESQRFTNGRVDQDLLASRAAQSVGGLPPPEAENSFTSRDATLAGTSLVNCMNAKGYSGG